MVRFQTMTPQEYKKSYANFKIIYAFHTTPFGDCLLGITDTHKAILYLAFVDSSKEEALARLKDDWPLSESLEDKTNETTEIVEKIVSERVSTNDSISILLKGTEFQIKVWEALLHIPDGTTVTYEQIACDINKPKAARAVGNAVMKNHIAYLVPCHRVMGKSGSNKYQWGAKLKEEIQMYERKYLNS